MKKGISLIVLVITIIVMIIIAGAIIISLNSSNVIEKANTAVTISNEAEAKSVLAMEYANKLAVHYAANPTVNFSLETNLADIADAVEAATDNKYTVEIVNNAYKVKVVTAPAG